MHFAAAGSLFVMAYAASVPLIFRWLDKKEAATRDDAKRGSDEEPTWVLGYPSNAYALNG